mmetsp:Transcript_104119/g.195965  ORF Transcript_104119/g.195965 Transcript_104119/m.195965 type:complete len:368 (+) Transcript_104119:142-1245(+)
MLCAKTSDRDFRSGPVSGTAFRPTSYFRVFTPSSRKAKLRLFTKVSESPVRSALRASSYNCSILLSNMSSSNRRQFSVKRKSATTPTGMVASGSLIKVFRGCVFAPSEISGLGTFRLVLPTSCCFISDIHCAYAMTVTSTSLSPLSPFIPDSPNPDAPRFSPPKPLRKISGRMSRSRPLSRAENPSCTAGIVEKTSALSRIRPTSSMPLFASVRQSASTSFRRISLPSPASGSACSRAIRSICGCMSLFSQGVGWFSSSLINEDWLTQRSVLARVSWFFGGFPSWLMLRVRVCMRKLSSSACALLARMARASLKQSRSATESWKVLRLSFWALAADTRSRFGTVSLARSRCAAVTPCRSSSSTCGTW